MDDWEDVFIVKAPLCMTENIAFGERIENPSLEVESKQGERRERIERLRRELAEARVDLDKAIIILGTISPLGKFVRGKEYKEALGVFQKTSKRVRRICNTLDNEFVTGEESFVQSDISDGDSAELRQQESWERNIPPRTRNGQ